MYHCIYEIWVQAVLVALIVLRVLSYSINRLFVDILSVCGDFVSFCVYS